MARSSVRRSGVRSSSVRGRGTSSSIVVSDRSKSVEKGRAPLAPEDEFSEEEDSNNATQATVKKKEKFLKMVAFKYIIGDEKHPFYNLNGCTGSVETDKIKTKTFDHNNVSIILI